MTRKEYSLKILKKKNVLSSKVIVTISIRDCEYGVSISGSNL